MFGPGRMLAVRATFCVRNLAGVLALVAGPLADQYGYRAMLVVGLLTIVVSTVATGLAPTSPIRRRS